jgi:RNA methyltransferase, TrmH family
MTYFSAFIRVDIVAIMSLSKSDVKYVKSLGIKKYRQKYNKFVVEGDKMVQELLRQHRFSVEALFALPAWLEKTAGDADKQADRCEAVSEQQLAQLSLLSSPHQALAVVEIPEAADCTLPQDGWSLYLDGLQDPANLGAILRVADWFGMHKVVLGPGTVDLYNPKTIQASMGSFLRVSCPECSLQEIATRQPSLLRLGGDAGGGSIFDLTLPPAGVLVIGREGSGLREETTGLLQQLVNIPPGKGGGAESLNAAVATGILCAVIDRQISVSSI